MHDKKFWNLKGLQHFYQFYEKSILISKNIEYDSRLD